MKYIISIFLYSLCVVSIMGQCNFEIIDFKESKINATPREMFVLQENQEVLTGNYVLFSMYTDGDSKYLLTTFSRVARDPFPVFCYGEGAFLSLVFKDDTSVTINYQGEEFCEKQQKHPTRQNFNALKIDAIFKIPKEVVSDLKKQKIASLIISDKEGSSYMYPIVKKIDDQKLGAISHPSSFFQSYLHCLEAN